MLWAVRELHYITVRSKGLGKEIHFQPDSCGPGTVRSQVSATPCCSSVIAAGKASQPFPAQLQDKPRPYLVMAPFP